MAKGETVQKEKPKTAPLTDAQKVDKKVEELKEAIIKIAEKEGKSENFQILNSVSKSAIKSLEGGKVTLDWKKIGDNLAIFSRIPKPTNEDCKKILLQLQPYYLDLELRVKHPEKYKAKPSTESTKEPESSEETSEEETT